MSSAVFLLMFTGKEARGHFDAVNAQADGRAVCLAARCTERGSLLRGYMNKRSQWGVMACDPTLMPEISTGHCIITY